MSLVLTMTLRLPRRLTSIYRKLELKASRRHHQLHIIRSRNVEFLSKRVSDANLELWAACTIVVVYITAIKRYQSQIPRCPGTSTTYAILWSALQVPTSCPSEHRHTSSTCTLKEDDVDCSSV